MLQKFNVFMALMRNSANVVLMCLMVIASKNRPSLGQ